MSSMCRTFGSIAHRLFRFSIWAAAPVIFFTSAGSSATKASESIRTRTLSSRERPSFSALVALSREFIRKRRCPIWEENSTSLPVIASVFNGSHATKIANGLSGLLPIGSFSLAISGHDSSNNTDVSCWNLTRARMVLHFLPMNCARSFCRKARAFFAGKRCLQWIQTNTRDLNRSGRDIAPRCPNAAARRPYLVAAGVSTLRSATEDGSPAYHVADTAAPTELFSARSSPTNVLQKTTKKTKIVILD